MPRARAEHGSYAAYRRHLQESTEVCGPCRDAQRAHDAGRSNSAAARLKRQAEADVIVLPAVPLEPESDHISRLEVLKEQLTTSRETIERLKTKDPARVYLLMREQRETLREISEIQGNGQVKGVTLADQLEAAREARRARAAGA